MAKGRYGPSSDIVAAILNVNRPKDAPVVMPDDVNPYAVKQPKVKHKVPMRVVAQMMLSAKGR